MSSSSSAIATPSSLFLLANINGSTSSIRHRFTTCRSNLSVRSKQLRLSASLADNHPHSSSSWLSPSNSELSFNGWAVVEPPPPPRNNKGFSKILIIGCGACVFAVVAAVACFSLSSKGFILRFPSPIHSSELGKVEAKTGEIDVVSDVSSEFVPEPAEEAPISVSTKRFKRVKVPFLVDSTQLEALSVLKTLQIIEDDMSEDELCTRREYARWLVRLNSVLERNPKYRIAYPSPSGFAVAAFDDVSVEDPDFEFIQALAEAGFIRSKISEAGSSIGDGSFCFHPERFISRQDLIDWKAQLEYQFEAGITEQMSRTKVDYMDVKDITSDASPEFYMDLLAGDNSIIRKVFGQSRRFQPNKPLTKAQAAVALTSGRMSEAIYNEMLRMEAENSSRQAQLKEIRSELLDKGEMERFWVEKMSAERTHGLEVQKLYVAFLHDLEEEKLVQVKTLEECLKEMAAMDCQRQLLVNIKEEVDHMSEQLASDKTTFVSEQYNLQKLLSELQTKQEGMLDKKSVLEAEIEALRILSSWVEDEAKKSQARAKVLEEVGRRWKWENQG